MTYSEATLIGSDPWLYSTEKVERALQRFWEKRSPLTKADYADMLRLQDELDMRSGE